MGYIMTTYVGHDTFAVDATYVIVADESVTVLIASTSVRLLLIGHHP